MPPKEYRVGLCGWEWLTDDTTCDTRANQQSWILIPFDMLSATDRMRR